MTPSSPSSDIDRTCGDCVPGDDSLLVPGDDLFYFQGDNSLHLQGDDTFCFHQSEGYSHEASPDSSLLETLPLPSYGTTMKSLYVPRAHPRSSHVDYSSGHAEGICVDGN